MKKQEQIGVKRLHKRIRHLHAKTRTLQRLLTLKRTLHRVPIKEIEDLVWWLNGQRRIIKIELTRGLNENKTRTNRKTR